MAKMSSNHDETKDLIAPYVLGALDPDEVSAVRAHILSCEECMREADSFAQVTSDMALAVDPVDLPPGFTDSVLAAASPSAEEVPVAKKRRGIRTLPIFGMAAALIATAILSVSLIQTKQKLNDYEQLVTAVLHSEGGMELTGSGAVARMVPANGGSVFVVTGMREAPDNHTYELWLIDGETPVSAGTFDVSGGIALLESDHSIEGFDGAAVTIEPSGGAPGGRPTTDPIMTATG